MSKKPIVLVLCTGNSCRSQMAEGLLRHYHGDAFEVHSAGTQPAERTHPMAVRVMEELGIDISGQRPKSLERYLGREAVRHLLIVCDSANGACPRVWPGTYTREYMPFDDPASFEGSEQATLLKFREVRDQIDDAMKAWAPSAEARA